MNSVWYTRMEKRSKLDFMIWKGVEEQILQNIACPHFTKLSHDIGSSPVMEIIGALTYLFLSLFNWFLIE